MEEVTRMMTTWNYNGYPTAIWGEIVSESPDLLERVREKVNERLHMAVVHMPNLHSVEKGNFHEEACARDAVRFFELKILKIIDPQSQESAVEVKFFGGVFGDRADSCDAVSAALDQLFSSILTLVKADCPFSMVEDVRRSPPTIIPPAA